MQDYDECYPQVYTVSGWAWDDTIFPYVKSD